MPLSIILAGLWLAVAWGTKGASPRVLWPAAWMLIATGIPLLGFVTVEAGPVAGLCGLALGAFLIRRPRAEETARLGTEP